jgi:16S rRNA processing protein RimM
MTERFVVGVLGAPFGVRGQLKLRLPSGEAGHLRSLTEATLRLDGKERKLKVEAVTGAAANCLVKFVGYDSPEAAQALVGAEILADRAKAAPLKRGEYYIEDLRGLAVKLAGRSEAIGSIRDVMEGGGGQMIEIALVSGAVRLVPFRSEFFGAVDPAAGFAELLVDWILE